MTALLIAPFIALAVIGYFCRSKTAKWILWTAVALAAIVAVAIGIDSLIDLSACSDSFLKGMHCPPDIAKSFAFALASWSYGIAFFGALALVYVAWLPVVVAIGLELDARCFKQ